VALGVFWVLKLGLRGVEFVSGCLAGISIASGFDRRVVFISKLVAGGEWRISELRRLITC
jgi:hypothetical protein